MRLAEKKDIKKLCILRIEQQRDDWKDEFEDNYNLLDRTNKYLKNHINKDLFVYIEEHNQEIIATCGLQIINYLPQCNDNGIQGFICNVYTKKDYRCKGIQTALLNEVINLAKEKEICELNLSTDSKDAISIYKKFGFKFDELMMYKKI